MRPRGKHTYILTEQVRFSICFISIMEYDAEWSRAREHTTVFSDVNQVEISLFKRLWNWRLPFGQISDCRRNFLLGAKFLKASTKSSVAQPGGSFIATNISCTSFQIFSPSRYGKSWLLQLSWCSSLQKCYLRIPAYASEHFSQRDPLFSRVLVRYKNTFLANFVHQMYLVKNLNFNTREAVSRHCSITGTETRKIWCLRSSRVDTSTS